MLRDENTAAASWKPRRERIMPNDNVNGSTIPSESYDRSIVSGISIIGTSARERNNLLMDEERAPTRQQSSRREELLFPNRQTIVERAQVLYERRLEEKYGYIWLWKCKDRLAACRAVRHHRVTLGGKVFREWLHVFITGWPSSTAQVSLPHKLQMNLFDPPFDPPQRNTKMQASVSLDSITTPTSPAESLAPSVVS